MTERRKYFAFAIALISATLVTLIRWGLEPWLGSHAPLIAAPLAVIVSAWYGGFRPGLVAMLISISLASLLFIEPRYSLAIHDLEDQIRIAITFGEGLVICGLFSVLHRTKQRALDSESRFRCIYEHATTGVSLLHHASWRDHDESAYYDALVREASTLQKQIFDSIEEGLVVFDRQLRYIKWNGFMERLTGVPAETVLGRHPDDVFPWMRDKGITELLERSMQGEVLQHPDLPSEHEATGDQLWLSARSSPLRDPNGEVIGVVTVLQDLTARKAIEDDLAKSREIAETTNRAKSAFLANMSHEIRTPLAAILGFADLLSNETLTAADRATFLDTIRRNGMNLTRLIEDILDLSKVEAERLEVEKIEFDVGATVLDVLRCLQVQAEAKGIEFALKTVGRVPKMIVSDPLRLRQILMNIVGNAIKFTAVGRVVVTLRYDQQKERMSFVVQDSGCGLSSEEAQKLFDAFSQADPSTTRRFGGTGLGLSLSRRLARLLGGDVTLERTAPGKGSTFVVTIRATSINSTEWLKKGDDIEEFRPMPAAAKKLLGKPLKGIRIVLAEDTVDTAKLIKWVLTRQGAQIDSVDNGADAMRIAMRGKCDLVLMDMQMPLMDGYEATRCLRQKGFAKPIIALTAHAMNEEKKKSFDAGCDDHLSKPIESKRLVETISRYVGEAKLHS